MPDGSWGGSRCQPRVVSIMPFLRCPSSLLHPDPASKALLPKFWNIPEWLVEKKLLRLGFVYLVRKLGW